MSRQRDAWFVPPPAADGAWARFQRLDQRRQPDALAELQIALTESAPAFNLDPGAVTLAAELVALQPDLDPPTRAALTVLVLVTLADVQQGCTRTPIEGDPGLGHLLGRFHGLLAPAGMLGGAPAAALARDWVDLARAALAEDRVAGLVGRDRDADRPLLLLDGWLAHQRMERAEHRLATRLAFRRSPDEADARELDPDDPFAGLEAEQVPDRVARALAEVLARPAGVTLSDEQQRAVERAARAPLTLISGGPGTGKTSIVVAVLRVLVRLGVEPGSISLAAPTGKAAWRMGQAVRGGLARLEAPDAADQTLIDALPEPATLHRLLGYSPSRDRFRHHGGDPLDAEVIIVDESSMVDVFLMERLATAARPETRLVLLGDADQLPSVAAGAVFRDVLAACARERVQLTRSYRMRAEDPAGRAVLTVARRLNAGETPLGLRAPMDDGRAPWATRATPDALLGEGVEHISADRAGLRAFLEHWYRVHVRGAPEIDRLRRQTWTMHDGRIEPAQTAALGRLFAHLESARILCLTRAFDTGAERTNRRLHTLAARDARQPADIRLLVGEPVMMLHNDYDRGLFNGDQGVILWVEADGRRQNMAVFPALDGYRVHPLSTLDAHLDLAYAMTVHKSQGSEFERVALILPADNLPLLSRELVYTGITRSRRGVILVGDPARLAYAAAHPVTRYSGLAERLGGSRSVGARA